MRSKRLRDRQGHRGHRGLVEHDLDALHRFRRGLEIGAVAGQDLDIVANRAEVVPLSGRKVVEHPDLVAALEERFHQMRPDETRTAGNEDSLH